MKAFARICLCTSLIGSGIVLGAPPAGAAFHLMKIKEVFVGTGGHSDAQHIELQMYSANQQFVANHRVVVYDATDAAVGNFTFATAGSNGDNQATMLIQTTAGETFFGTTADLEMTPVMSAAGGAACFVNNNSSSNIDCVSWGSFVDGTGGATDTGPPFSASEGIPSGAAIERKVTGGTNATLLEAADDTQSSAADFAFAPPSPDNNSALEAVGAAPGGELSLASAGLGISEGAAATVEVRRGGGTAGAVTVSHATGGGTADPAADYTPASGTTEFGPDDASPKSFPIASADDSDVEAAETVGIALRDPTGGAVLAPPFDAILTISDDDTPPDTMRPTSRISRPVHRSSYRQSRLRSLKGTAADAQSGVARVQVALRRTMTNGSCRWWTGSGWRAGSCSTRLWKNVAGTTSWSYSISRLLSKSVGTTTRYYTAFARARDVAGNLEARLRAGRNANRFEIK